MLRKIVVPLDGSRFAEEALPVALRLARRDGARLELVTVYPPPLPLARTGNAPVRDPSFDWAQQRDARNYLNVLLGRIDARDRVRTSTALLQGMVVETLRGHIEETGADLVVMTTHARGGARRAWLGSVADGLVRQSPVPVLLLHPSRAARSAEAPTGPVPVPERLQFEHVLLPLDGFPGGEQILGPAVALAGTDGVQYSLLRVLATDESPVLAALPSRGDRPNTRMQRATVEARLESTAEKLRTRGLEVETDTVVDDARARGILEYAAQNGVDLIAMTTRSRGGLERMLLGSVADRVLRAWTGPLLLLNPGAAVVEA